MSEPSSTKQASAKETIPEEGGFIVHARHTCDNCSTKPIIGRRYRSGVLSDFDLCSKCYVNYNGPDIKMSETLLARDRQLTKKYALKLMIENGREVQIRRVKVADLWDPSASQLSFAKLTSLAQGFAYPGKKADCETHAPTVTYVDGDGDKITVSTDEELDEAFRQTVKNLISLPFRVVVSYRSMGNIPTLSPKKNAKPFELGCETLGGRVFHVPNVPGYDFGHDLSTAVQQAYALIETLIKIVLAIVTIMQGKATNQNHFGTSSVNTSTSASACDGATAEAATAPTEPGTKNSVVFDVSCAQVLRSVAEEIANHNNITTNIINDGNNDPESSGNDDSSNEVTKEAEAENVCRPFIHARHTCDGCSKTPIIGNRYHATKIPDFDLCESCFKEYKGEDLDFKTEVLDRDRPMQERWARRQHSRQARAARRGPRNGNGPVFRRGDRMTRMVEEAFKHYAKSQIATADKESADANENAPKQPPSVPAPSAPPSEDTANNENNSQKDTSGNSEDKKLEELNTECSKNTAVSVVTKPASTPEKPPSKDSSATNVVDKTPSSESHDQSFLSDADGNGSIAEVIGRTLDVCVQAMDAMADEIDVAKLDEKDGVSTFQRSLVGTPSGSKQAINNNKDAIGGAAASVAVDAFSVASSMVSSMTDILKKIDEPSKSGTISAGVPVKSIPEVRGAVDVPSVITGATILNSVEDEENKQEEKDLQADDASEGDDSWSVVETEQKETNNDKSIARAAEMIGSALFASDMSPAVPETRNEEKEAPINVFSSTEPISSVVLARWDAELKQLHEIGFLDDRKNIDALEHLQAANVGVDSNDAVTVNAAVNYLLARSI